MKNPSQIHQKSLKIGPGGSLGGAWGPAWPQDGPKSEKDLQKSVRGPPLDPPSWSQNPPKFDPEAIKIDKKTNTFFSCFFNRFLVDFERILEAKIVEKSIKNQ